MELFTEIKRSMVARKRISTKNLYYGYVGVVQQGNNGDNYVVFKDKYVIVRKCTRNGKVFYEDVLIKNVKYGSNDDLSLLPGSVIFHVEDSINEFLLPNEMYLNEVTYGRLLDLYYELNEDYMCYENDGKIAKVLDFKKK